mgnify:CR=1 FL=1
MESGYGDRRDLDHIEDGGRLEGADPSKVSGKAKKRGAPQLISYPIPPALLVKNHKIPKCCLTKQQF